MNRTKTKIYVLLFLVFSLLGCGQNPTGDDTQPEFDLETLEKNATLNRSGKGMIDQEFEFGTAGLKGRVIGTGVWSNEKSNFKVLLWDESRSSFRGPYDDKGSQLAATLWMEMRDQPSHDGIDGTRQKSTTGIYEFKDFVFTMRGAWEIRLSLYSNTTPPTKLEEVKVIVHVDSR